MLVTFGFSFAITVANATTIGTNVSTADLTATGNLTVSGTASYTFDATEGITIDAATVDRTATSTGAINLNVDAGASGVSGQTINLTNRGNYSGQAQTLNIVQPTDVALGSTKALTGSVINITGNSGSTNADNATATYLGTSMLLGATYSGPAAIKGHDVNFSNTLGGVGNVSGNGGVSAFSATIKRTGGTGITYGINIAIDDDSTAPSANATGLNIAMDLATGEPTTSAGIVIYNMGGTGSTLADGINIDGSVSGSVITRGIKITNGNQTMNSGILISNSNGGTLANGLSIGNSGTGSVTTIGVSIINSNNQTMAAGLSITNSGGGTLTNAIGINAQNANSAITNAINVSNGSQTMTNGLLIDSPSGGAITYAISAADSDIVNAINIGSNHITSNGDAGAQAPTLSSCGTSPTISGSDAAGKITIGGGLTTSCTVTFKVAYSSTPACVLSGDNTAVTYIATTTTTAMTITSSADMQSDVISYICFEIGT